MVQPQILDPLALPLYGERLIEASAGTGKTFTIAALYLRLLLGLGGESAYPRPLSVEEILVVTFTEAATKELRGRIRENIHLMRLACVRNFSDDPLFSSLLPQIPDLAYGASQLLAAERQMDEAAIYTIHGFCQRMLAHNAFESGMLFEQTLVQDELPLRRQACADFWRRHCYPLPLAIARAVSQEWSGPEALLSDLMPYLQGEAPELHRPPNDEETLVIRHQQVVARIDDIKQQWRASAGELQGLISDSGVDKRSYSTRYLPVWLQAVGEWAESETEDYQLPNALDKFRQSVLDEKTKKGVAPSHSLFSAIDKLFDEPLTLRDVLLARALSEIRYSIVKEKRQRAEMGFDDLLSRLDVALRRRGGQALADTIRQRYPVAMIDEFQDTDPQQYRIFRAIYGHRPDDTLETPCGLLLIGDPKQAIYAFRGADIFTYMRARKEVNSHYTLETNWRSSHGMVNAVNQLFNRLPAPFLFAEIPFLAAQPAAKNAALAFEYQGKVQAPMQFWLQEGEGVGVSEYQQIMARQCAVQIRNWLTAGQEGAAWLLDGKERRAVEAADITVLVRSRAEAALIKDALSALAIPSVYLSNRESVFTTPEAKDVLWLLQAVLAPEHERTLRSALASGLLGLDAQTIENLNQNERAWDALVDEFDGYRQHWQRRGVLPMLREVMTHRHLTENILASEGGERRVTDILHLGELLQEASLPLDSEHALVRWLAQQISQPNHQADNQQLRLESDRHLVQIVTIHKSKGLQYPLVWLPFISNFRQQQQALYHDRQTFAATLDLHQGEEAVELAEEERLAEDLRLLYVALTRSVYHCSIGVAPLRLRNKKQGDTDLHSSALGYLIQKAESGDAAFLGECLNTLQDGDMALVRVGHLDDQIWQGKLSTEGEHSAREFKRSMADAWRVTSYSGLQQQGSHVLQELLPKLDVDAVGEKSDGEAEAMTLHSFPRGAAPGSFLHNLLEELDFTQPVAPLWLSEQVTLNGFSEEWLPVMEAWMETILQAPLNAEGLTLSALTPENKQAELQFYLPIRAPLISGELDRLIKHHDPLSARCPVLNFRQVQGMLKGFIDLVFCWEGRYYLLDYKSNWLGENSEAYTQEAMAQAMGEHRYDLQYQLYTLALHRFLRHRIPDYDYQTHFGGVFYLFLRGLEQDKPGHGVFYCRPEYELIAGMDEMFNGKNRADKAVEESKC